MISNYQLYIVDFPRRKKNVKLLQLKPLDWKLMHSMSLTLIVVIAVLCTVSYSCTATRKLNQYKYKILHSIAEVMLAFCLKIIHLLIKNTVFRGGGAF